MDLHPHTLTHMLNDAMKKAGVNKKGAVHILRHSLGAELRSKDVDVRDIQDLLRHSSITTTELYTQLSKKALLEKLQDKEP